MSLPIWLDCDPGHDDMMAIILASTSQALSMRGISTTHGNQSVEKTYQNARRTVFLTGKNIPVYCGYSQPLVRQSRVCPEIHGESGLGGVSWDEVDKQLPALNPGSADSFFEPLEKEINNFFSATNKKFTIVTTGAFTNVAFFLKARPHLAAKVRLVSMAGSFKTIGNIGPWAEFNVLIDPEACQYVLDAGVWITFIPLDVTHQVLVTKEVQKRVDDLKDKQLGSFISALLNFFRQSYKDVFFFEDPPLHDPVAVFYLLQPEAFQQVDVFVEIECQGKLTAGSCCPDWFNQLKKEKNCTVCLGINVDPFWDAMIKAVAACKGMK